MKRKLNSLGYFLEDNLKKYKEILYLIARNLSLLYILFLILEITNLFLIKLCINLNLFFFIVLLLDTIALIFYYTFEKNTKWIEKIAKYSFFVFLMLVTFSSLNIEFLKPISSFLLQYQTYLIILTIAFGAVTFWQNREVTEGTKEEQSQEEKVEKKRKKEFEEKFQWINKVPLLRPIVKWIYKAGWLNSIGLILIICLYLFIQFSMFQYSGNYPDEYSHILSGKNLLETGEFPILNNCFDDQGYLRGAPISYLVALFFSIFGMSLFVAKLVPIVLGLINLLLLSQISKNIISSKKVRFVLLFIFVFSSWLIFNHFYIRHYVFLEFSLLFLTYAMIKLDNNISNKQWKNAGYLFLIILINFINYFFMHDSTKYLISFATLFGLGYLFLFKSQEISTNTKYLKYLFNLSFLKKIILILICFAIILIIISNFLNISSIINRLLIRTTNTGTNHFNFNSFFFGIYIFFTIFFLLGLLGNFILKKKNKIIYFLVLPLLALHYISSESMQIMRVMVYLLPIFYLLACNGLDNVIIIFKKNKIISIILLILFIIPTMSILQDDYDRFFSNGYPVFLGEIGYHEYSKQYKFMKNNLENYTVFAAQYNIQKQEFFGFEYNYKLDFLNITVNHYSHYVDENGITRQFFTNTPVIKDFAKFKQIIKTNKSCVVLKPFSKSRFLGEEKYNFIISNMKLINETIGFKTYCN